MTTFDWAISIKPKLVELQNRTGIPALAAAAHFCHESASDAPGGISTLARVYHNYAGMKWVGGWQADEGCSPTPPMGTWEEEAGKAVDRKAVFASCRDFDHGLEIYASLLMGRLYGPCLEFNHDPMLYMYAVWQKGWATDSAYLTRIGWWMARLYPEYKDTLIVDPPAPAREVVVTYNGTATFCWPDGK